MTQETITWIPAAERLPDDDRTVMVATLTDDVAWPGYYDNDGWRDVNGGFIWVVTHWADMLKGPDKQQKLSAQGKEQP